MSSLGAFFRGAAGPGMLALADSYERRDLEEAKAKQRADEIASEQAFRADQAKQDRMARYGTDGTTPGAARASGSSSGGGGTKGDDTPPESLAVAEVMRKTGMSQAQAMQAVKASMTGQNPYSKPTQTVEQFDDGEGRMRNATKNGTEPDEERFVQLNRMVGQAFSDSMGKPKDRADAERTRFGTEAGRAAVANPGAAGTLGQGVAVSEGKPLFQKGDNEYTGMLGAVSKSEITENQAQAGSASRANRDGDPLTKLPPAVQATVKQLDAREKEIMSNITKAQAEVGGWDPKANPGQAQLQSELAAVRIRQRQTLAPYMPEAKGAPGGADPLGLGIGKEPPKDGGKPAPTQGDARKAEKPPAKPAEGADQLAGLTRQAARAKRAELAAELKRWEGVPNAEARIAEIRDLIDRIDTGRF